VRSSLKRSLANHTKQGIDQLVVLVKARLKPMQYWPGLLDGFLAKTGLGLAVGCPARLDAPASRSAAATWHGGHHRVLAAWRAGGTRLAAGRLIGP
jgi:hypothetical protein